MTKALKSGAVKSDLVTFDFCGPKVANQGFKPMVRERKFDAGELAIGTFLQAKIYGKPVTLLPAVVMGRFQHQPRAALDRSARRSAPATSRASASASAPTRRPPASGCAASSSTNTAST